MNAVVFLGPTLSVDEARTEFDAVYLPPVSQGDVYRAAVRGPAAIGIVDGRYQDVPAVWHNEILWALNAGIPVYGSGSMGALRAAELAEFGMRGVGDVYHAFLSGRLEDDDEVAIVHGGIESRYQAGSEAMVNIRTTLDAAEAAGVFGPLTRDSLVQMAKEQFFAERNYHALLERAAVAGLPSSELDALARWLPDHRIDQKKRDALSMLALMREELSRGRTAPSIRFNFQHTQFFERARRFAGDLEGSRAIDPRAGGGSAEPLTLSALLNEARLLGDEYVALREQAFFRCLAVKECRRQGYAGSDGSPAMASRFAGIRGDDPLAIRTWMMANDLTTGQLRALLREESMLDHVRQRLRTEVAVYERNALRACGRYAERARCALEKKRVLRQNGKEDVGSLRKAPELEVVLSWYFMDRLNRPVPADIAAYAQALGYSSDDEFIGELYREFWFNRLSSSSSQPVSNEESNRE